MSLGQVILITGPTAAGKTELAMKLYDRLGGAKNAHLVSVDSAMVYRGLDIGTAKPQGELLAQYPHSLIDVREPDEHYSVADFVKDADRIVRTSILENRTPILVGGTMLYIKCFRDGISNLPEKNEDIRKKLEEEIEKRGLDALHQELEANDPEAARNIHPHNRQRIMRAMEVFLISGRKISELWKEQPSRTLAERLGQKLSIFAVLPEEKVDLEQRIEDRFTSMLDRGLLEELTMLRQNYRLDLSCPSMRTVGYRQAWQHLEGVIDRAQFVADSIRATKLLAKKQMTWLRAWKSLETIHIGEARKLWERVERILTSI